MTNQNHTVEKRRKPQGIKRGKNIVKSSGINEETTKGKKDCNKNWKPQGG